MKTMKMKFYREFIEKPEVVAYGSLVLEPARLSDGSWAWIVAENSFDTRYSIGDYDVVNLPGRAETLNDLIDDIEVANEN